MVPEVSFEKLGSSLVVGGALDAPGPKHLSHSPSPSEGTQAGTIQCRERAKPSRGCTSFWSFSLWALGDEKGVLTRSPGQHDPDFNNQVSFHYELLRFTRRVAQILW